MRSIALILVLSVLALPASAGIIVEESSGTEFPSILALAGESGDIMLEARGVGIRTKFRIKVYAACFYAEAGTDWSGDPYITAIEGDFAKRIVMRFLRNVGAEKISGAYRDGIRKSLEGHDEAVEGFCDLFTEEVLKGETIILSQIPGTGLQVEQNGKLLGLLTDPEVIQALWATWFGDKPISKKLKKGMLGL